MALNKRKWCDFTPLLQIIIYCIVRFIIYFSRSRMNSGYQRTRYRFNCTIEQKLKSLFTLNNWNAIIALLYDYMVIALAIFISLQCHFFYPLAVIVIGSRQRALATLLHESIHNVLAKNKTLNRLLGTFFSGYLICQSYTSYKNSHAVKHHTFLGDKTIDPDYNYHLKLGIYDSFHHQNNKNKKMITLLKLFTYPIYLIKNRMNIFLLRSKEDVVGTLYIGALLLIIFELSLFQFFFYYWLVPFFTSFFIIGWFIELAEHYPMIHHHHEDILMSRNRFSHYIEALFLSIHNENFHLIHHLRPGIPFWNMKKAHKIMMNDSNYAAINNQMGGIFISSNNNKTVFFIFLKNFIYNHHKGIAQS